MLEREIHIPAAQGERGQLSVENSAAVGPANLRGSGQTGGLRGELHGVVRRRPAQGKRGALERAAAEAQVMQPGVDARLAPGGVRIEVNVRVEALECQAVVAHAPG